MTQNQNHEPVIFLAWLLFNTHLCTAGTYDRYDTKVASTGFDSGKSLAINKRNTSAAASVTPAVMPSTAG